MVMFEDVMSSSLSVIVKTYPLGISGIVTRNLTVLSDCVKKCQHGTWWWRREIQEGGDNYSSFGSLLRVFKFWILLVVFLFFLFTPACFYYTQAQWSEQTELLGREIGAHDMSEKHDTFTQINGGAARFQSQPKSDQTPPAHIKSLALGSNSPIDACLAAADVTAAAAAARLQGTDATSSLDGCSCWPRSVLPKLFWFRSNLCFPSFFARIRAHFLTIWVW